MHKISNFEVTSGNYTVRLAKDRTEVESALNLRFRVFNIELGEGLEESYSTKLDEDEYDEFCDHLIVIQNKTSNVIGTYRIQDNDSAERGKGFYTANEFDILAFPDFILNDSFELGRACIDKEHRNGRVLFLLWRGLAKYMILSEKRFLFGCCSITSQDQDEGQAYFNFLKQNNFMHPEYLINVQELFICESGDNSKFEDELKLPQLFRLYLDIGCKVCSPPAIDREFKTIDFLILLDLETISEQTRALFLK